MAGGAQIKHTEESEVRTAIWDMATSPPYHRGKTSAGRIMNEVLRKSRDSSQKRVETQGKDRERDVWALGAVLPMIRNARI